MINRVMSAWKGDCSQVPLGSVFSPVLLRKFLSVLNSVVGVVLVRPLININVGRTAIH